MSSRYRYDYRSKWRKKAKGLTIVFVLVAILIGIGLIVKQGLINNQPVVVTGSSQVVGKVLGDSSSTIGTNINEPFFSLGFPNTWLETARINQPNQNSIKWTSQTGTRGITLTLYIDTIPTNLPVNRVLPLQPHGSGVTWGQLSDDCTNFTAPPPAGSQTAVPGTWQSVPFLCNYPGRYLNQVGTGSPGDLNSVTLSGPKSGTHKYFFLYVDNSAEPNYSTFFTILNNFQAK